ncbi:MAG: hypothetical protein AAFO29_27320, partial [Actinomycetota bacterium]
FEADDPMFDTSVLDRRYDEDMVDGNGAGGGAGGGGRNPVDDTSNGGVDADDARLQRWWG